MPRVSTETLNKPTAAVEPPLSPRIVGLGASAGGLEALEQFFEHVPPNSGLAYVVVQHLDPTKKALLVELLQRASTMPVREAQETMRILPDCVYVIRPNTELSVAGGMLKVDAPSEPRGMRLPVNVLFSSLARDQHEAAIGVVLSGMGSDGTLGLQAIKALGGLSAVQKPATAQFDSMPNSAINAGYADIIATPAELPGRILATINAPSETLAPDLAGVADEPLALPGSPMESIFRLLRQRTRHDFSLYKPNTVQRRIQRRMAIHSIPTLAQYAEFLQTNPHETTLLFKELLIGVTQFFRDAPVWAHFANHALPELLNRRAEQTRLRAWIIGCSTGEEAYSLAMVFTETVQRLPQFAHHTLQIFASDLSPDAIASARRGEYPTTIVNDVSPQRLERCFTLHDGRYVIAKAIRDMVLFAEQDVILDPPFTRLDILCCRNLMIYFDATLQQKLLPLFHYSLRGGGVLMLGSSETVGRFNRLFTAIDSKLRLYRRPDGAATLQSDFLVASFPPLSNLRKELAVPSTSASIPPTDGLQAAAERVLLHAYAPPAVVVNGEGDIVYISGRTGQYLEPAAGKANWNFHAMVRDGLREPLAESLRQAALQDDPLHYSGLQVRSSDGLQSVDVTVQKLREPAALHGMTIIVFRHVAAPVKARTRRGTSSAIEQSQAAQLENYRDEIQRLREETRASKEELQSTNEELQSTNEELQSANEELTTSKEEMQSMNEELQTVNAEMQTRLDDLAMAQGDMTNLLNSTDIAILFLDHDLNVRRYTERASKIINLREIDIGRPLSDLTTSLQYPSLHADAEDTMRSLVFSEKQICTTDDRWFSVRIMPYRRLDNAVEGAVITFVDITATKELEAKLRQR